MSKITKYQVWFGEHKQATIWSFRSKNKALLTKNKLMKNLPHIKFGVRKIKVNRWIRKPRKPRMSDYI